MAEEPSPLLAIGAVARLTGLSVKTIRYYADIGLAPPSAVAPSGYRHYAPEDVWRLEVIRTLRQMEFGIEEIRHILTGSRSVQDAIALHLDALNMQIDHLTRVRDLVAQMQAHGEDASMADLHRLGQVVSSNAAERQAWFEHAIRAMVVDPTAPAAWQQHVLDGFMAYMPPDPSPAQAAALARLHALASDPAQVATSQAGMAGFWAGVRRGTVDVAWWQSEMAAIGAQAQAALAQDADPESDAVQAVVQHWLDFYATVRQKAVTDAFIREMTQQAESWIASRSTEFADALRDLAADSETQNFFAVENLILAGLRWRIAQMEADATEGV